MLPSYLDQCFQMTLSCGIHWRMHLQLLGLVLMSLTIQTLDFIGDPELVLPPFPRVKLEQKQEVYWKDLR
jgi:hypothetical protein